MEFTPTLLISGVALLVSIITFFMSRYYQANDRKKALTIEMWKTWEGAELRAQRILSWKSVTEASDGDVGPQNSFKSTDLNSEEIRAFNDVELFLEGLGKLRKNKQLDEKLFKSLFEPNLSLWRKVSSSVERLNNNHLRSFERLQLLFSRFD